MAEKKTNAPRTPAAEAAGTDDRIDDAIASVETLYQAVTGKIPPPLGEDTEAPIPVERDPGEFLGEQLERLLVALPQGDLPGAEPAAPAWSPPVSVWEDEREMVVCLDLAGVPKSQVKLVVEGNCLFVRGGRPAANDGMRLAFSERPLGPFERRVLLPPRVSPAEPEARLRDGVLEIRLDKRPSGAAARREIPLA